VTAERVEGGGEEAFPCRVAGGAFPHNTVRIGIRDGGDKSSPGWFLDKEDISGRQLEDTFHSGTLFVDVDG
jgi:hypothetical protein